jgi:hypothetical protein
MGTYEEVQLATMSRQVWSKTAADDLAERARTISRNVRVHRKEMAGGNRYTVVR